MRKIAKRDANHSDIVDTFRSLGMSVLDLGALGDGAPDLVVGAFGINVLVEVKDGSKPPSQRQLTPDQVDFFATWKGEVIVIKDARECEILRNRMLAIANALKRDKNLLHELRNLTHWV